MTVTSERQPSPATIRRVLAQLLTLEAIGAEMGWSAGTAAKYRQRGPDGGGLPAPDWMCGRTPVWFRGTFERWRAGRPGRGAGGGRPRRAGA